MKSLASTRLILLHPSLPKSGNSFLLLRRLLAFISFSAFAFLLLITLLSSSPPPLPLPPAPRLVLASPVLLHPLLFHTLLHYATTHPSTPTTGIMPEPDLRSIAHTLRLRAPCNLLIFGLGPETPLWRALNLGGRTVFVDENQHYIAYYEDRHPGFEGYDVAYTTKVSQLNELIQDARARIRGECKPVQNLLFSDCRLAINDLPNYIYDVGWDVIVVDGPRGYSAESPGRMSSIYTAAVLARSESTEAGRTDVFVHDYEREVERVCGEEFLCGENLVGVEGQLAHFVLRGGAAARKDGFCFNRTATAAVAS